MSIVIDQAIQARLIASAPGTRAIPARLRYEPTDPFAVRVSFPPAASLDGFEVEWAFGRDLLEEGLRRPAGSGDVYVWPCSAERIVLEFRADEGMAMVQLNSADVREFLGRSYALVPVGEEGGYLDVDADLAALLRDA
ncbi:SsgA family sporulation/cell division regulator [Streptomyces sp. 71268]|uniref:SsgA family sporulation/cell division regulator n=1 Tax=Streptomyces sp. 71268 TaxID=3002640 RepID=UPI0023F69624|nr:SsgA family sporulation/cell division regulator [Streptomyces sp. 71268]WEV28806.1 SsgA family sporulation/cell division regulator [Streptomyces sp. 71268]